MPISVIPTCDAASRADTGAKRRQTMAGYGPSRGAAAATATSPRKHAASQLGRAKSAEREASFAAATSGHATSTWTIPSRPIPAAATPAASSLAAPAQQQQKECAVHILYLPHGAIQLLLFASQQPAPAADQTATATPAPAPAQPCTAIIPYPPRGALRLPCATPAAAAAPQHSACQATASAPVSAAATLDLELSPEEAQWLVQPPALLDATTTISPPPAKTARAAAAVSKAFSRTAATARRLCSKATASAGAGVRHLRTRLATASCLARPAVAE